MRRASGGLRLLLLGYAITCPLRLEEPGWHSFGDTDLDVASGPPMTLEGSWTDWRADQR
jgi:hypothetical protein